MADEPEEIAEPVGKAGSVDAADGASEIGGGDDDGAQAAVGKKRSVRNVPRDTLETAKSFALKLYDTYGNSAPKESLAALLGHDTTNSGAFKDKLALLRSWSLVQGADPIELSDVGRSIIRGDPPEQQLIARQDAFKGSGPFNGLLQNYEDRLLPPVEDLATRCRFEFNLEEEAALEVAQVFVESAKYAGLVDEAGKVGGANEGPKASSETNNVPDGQSAHQSESDEQPDEPVADTGEPQGEGLIAETPASPSTREARASSKVTRELGPAPEDMVGSGRTLEIHLTLTGYDGAEAIEILRTIGYRSAQR